MTEQEEELTLTEGQPTPEVETQAEVAPEETGPVATKDEDGTFKLDLTGANEKPAELVEPEVTEVIEPAAEVEAEVPATEEFQALEEITEEEVSEIAEELQDNIQEAIEEQKVRANNDRSFMPHKLKLPAVSCREFSTSR